MHLIEKTLDPQGRILLPKEWRRKHGEKVLLLEMNEELRIVPKRHKKLSELSEIEADIKSSMKDWHSVKKELSRL